MPSRVSRLKPKLLPFLGGIQNFAVAENMKSVENSGTTPVHALDGLFHALARLFHALDGSFHGLSTVCPRFVHGLSTVKSEIVHKSCIKISRDI